MSGIFKSIAITGAAAVLAASAAAAQDFAYGESLFAENCAVCHGLAGAGDGPVGQLFAQQPSNLKDLSKNNNGVYPFSMVYHSIDGRRDIAGHGNTEMPIWGDLFMTEALPKTVHPGVAADEIVQARVLALVYYLQSIQN